MSDFDIKTAIEGMAAVTAHVRDCERCRRVYGAAYNAIREAHQKEGRRVPPNPWTVFFQCSRELHACERWPRVFL